MTRPLLTIAIICKDSAATIGRTLDASRALLAEIGGGPAGGDGEILGVDSGSTDATLAMLDAAGARVVRTPWLGYVRTKQLALDESAGEWVLSLDSDESPDDDLRRAIVAFLRDPGAHAGASVNRMTWYAGRPLRHAWQPERRLRLVRRGRGRWEGLDPHDKMVCDGPVAALAGHLRHDSIATWADFLAKQAGHSRLMARSLHAAGKRGSVLKLLTSPPGALLKQLVLKRAFLDGWPGCVAAASTAAGALMKHAMLLELTREAESDGARDQARSS